MSPTHDVKIKELMALGMAIVFTYVGAVVSSILVWNYSAQNPPFQVFWWIGSVCWILALILQARFGYRLAKRRGRNAEVGAITGLIIVCILMLIASFTT